ncbi:MAG: hypothetical protein ACOYL6_19295 [Bacteriovoracaceae bacterium]
MRNLIFLSIFFTFNLSAGEIEQIFCSGNILKSIISTPESSEFKKSIESSLQDLIQNPNSNLDSRNKIAQELMDKSKLHLQSIGVEFEESLNQKYIIIIPNKNSHYLNELAYRLNEKSSKKLNLIYHPYNLLNDSNEIFNQIHFYNSRSILLSHKDILGELNSHILNEQIKLIDHVSNFKNNGDHQLIKKHFDPFEDSGHWSNEKKTSVSEVFITAAKNKLTRSNIEFTVEGHGLKLTLNGNSAIENTLKEYKKNYPEIKKIIYDPKTLISANNNFEKSDYYLNSFTEENTLYLGHNEILDLKIGKFSSYQINKNFIEMDQEDKSFQVLIAKIEKYRKRKSSTVILINNEEPIVSNYNGNPLLKMLYQNNEDIFGNKVEEIFDNPYFDRILINQNVNVNTNEALFDQLLMSFKAGFRKNTIGNVLQFDKGISFINLNLASISKKTNLPNSIKNILDDYLKYLEQIYYEKIGISANDFQKLRYISEKLEKQSLIYLLAENKFDDISKFPTKSLNLKGGMIIVKSENLNEKLPMELLHNINLPRENGGIAEIGRMGSSFKDITLEFAKLAAIELKRSGKIKYIYVEADRARKILFERFGFKELEMPLKKESLYESGTDYILRANIDEFLSFSLDMPNGSLLK